MQVLDDFLEETGPLVERAGELPPETAAELWVMYAKAAESATANIAEIDPELRVAVCDRQDKLLERMADFELSFKDTGVRGVYTPAAQGFRRWKNIELLKDKGLAGYLLAGELAARPVMLFGTKPEDYPDRELLPGLEILCTDTPAGDSSCYAEQMESDYPKMDALVLHGMYNQTIGYLNAYRSVRPDGKVYCGLDMNTYWMKNIAWSSPEARQFAKQCDVTATSCRLVRDELNRTPSISFACHWLPNGFYNAANTKITADAGIKRNIILTAGRIGTNQKNNSELLMAFEQAHARLPGWELRLVGPIEKQFEHYISEYFEAFPYMRDKVTFTGPIYNKEALYGEYARAKLFALTSVTEGGTPNVFAEALVHGCMFVTSDIDAADDITDYGRLGRKYKSGDTNALAEALTELAGKAGGQSLKRHMSKAAAYAARYYDWRRNARKLAIMLFG
jgi:glycosyltransferase involved in cell wall biosynthesis